MAPSRAVEPLISPTLPPPKSTHVSDPTLQPFLSPTFSPTDYLNATLPPLSTPTHRPTSSVSLTDLSTQTQTLLSHLSAHTSRLSTTLTHLTDDILRSGSRMAYEVEVLRGETTSLAESLTDTLAPDIARFTSPLVADPSINPADAGSAAPATPNPNSPDSLNQLRTLSLVSERLDTVIRVFGAAMDWPFPPSEVSVASSFISVSAPEPGSDSHSQEEKGQEVAKKLREEIARLLDDADEESMEAARKKVEELRKLSVVWKGTAEEKARGRFVDGLARAVEERQKALDREAEERSKREGTTQVAKTVASPRKPGGTPPAVEAVEASEQGRFGWSGGNAGYGFINQLQKMRSGL